ncbi:MAG: DMT family transporter [Pseudomonadota bacterium]
MKPLEGKQDRAGLAILLTLAALFCFAGIDTSAKWLITAGVAPIVVVFFRYAGHLTISLALAVAQRDPAIFRMKRPRLTLARGALLLGATTMNFLSLVHLPLTVTVSIFFTMPLMTTVLAAIFLKEQVGPRRWTAVAIGLIGILVITQPWAASFHWAMFLTLLATFFTAIYSLLTRAIAGEEDPQTMQLYASLLPAIALAPFAIWGWTAPSGAIDWAFCILIGICGWGGHQLYIRALRYAEASALAPYTYAQIIFMTSASWLIFHHPPDFWTMVGAAIVAGSGLYIWLREQTLARA